jgi:hypothetical protein
MTCFCIVVFFEEGGKRHEHAMKNGKEMGQKVGMNGCESRQAVMKEVLIMMAGLVLGWE